MCLLFLPPWNIESPTNRMENIHYHDVLTQAFRGDDRTRPLPTIPNYLSLFTGDVPSILPSSLPNRFPVHIRTYPATTQFLFPRPHPAPHHASCRREHKLPPDD